MTRLSACLIVKDEERFLPDCLRSLVGVVDEIVVVDTGSSDRTVEIARAAGCVLGEFRWCDDFAAARNASLALASGDWILVVDADERLDPATRAALARATADAHAIAWLVDVDSVGAGDERVTARIPRLFRRRDDVRFERPIHESITASLAAVGAGDLGPSGVRLEHLGYRPDVLAERDKHARNLALLERAAERDPEDRYLLYKLAGTRRGRGQASAALAAFEELSVRLDRSSPDQLAELPFAMRASAEHVELALELADVGRAERAARRLTARWPEGALEPEPWLARAELALRLEDFDAARRALDGAEGARRAGSGSVSAGALERRLRACAARWAFEVGAFDELDRRVAGADAASAADLVALDVRAALRRGALEPAFERLGQLLERAPSDPETLLVAGEIAWWRGERGEARDLWTAAVGRGLAGRRAAAWRLVAALASGSGLDEAQRQAEAADLTTAAARALGAIVGDRPVDLDPVFDRPALIGALGRWLEELLQAGASEVVERFADRAARHAARWAGIDELVVRG